MSMPKSPRMQMINMMYLVLMALLAINVSASILKGFRIVQLSLEKSNQSADEKITQLHNIFSSALNNDPQNETIQLYAQKALKTKEICVTLLKRVEKYKADLEEQGTPDLVDNSRYVDMGNGIHELEQASNQDISSQYFILTNEGQEFKSFINESRAQILALIDDKEDHKTLNKNLALEEAIDPPNRNGEVTTWESDMFDNMPLAAVVTLLEKIKTDIKATEIEVLSTLMSKINQGNWNFDKMETNIMAGNRYLQTGQAFNAQIFVSAYSSTLSPEVLIGKLPESIMKDSTGKFQTMVQKENPLIEIYDTLSIADGKGNFEQHSSIGNHTYEGVIHLTNNGKNYWFPFRDEYAVVNNDLTVSATAMNVIYAGLDNPFQISVPGARSEDVSLVINDNKTKVKNLGAGKFEVKTMKNSGILKFKIATREPDGTTSMKDGGDYRVFPVPPPTSKLSLGPNNMFESEPISASKMNRLAVSYLIADLQNFMFKGVKYPITSYKIAYVAKKEADSYIPSESFNDTNLGNNPSLRVAMSKAKSGDELRIYNIKARTPSNQTIILNVISIFVQ